MSAEPVTLDLVAAWKLWATVEKGLASNTVRTYERELRHLGPDIADLVTEDLRRHLHMRGGKPATISRRIAAWRSFFLWLVRTDRRLDDPTAKLDRPKLAKGLPRPVENFEVVLRQLDPTSQCIAVFLVETGLRISEAIAVRVDGEMPDELRVQGKGSKVRIVPLTDMAKFALSELGGRMPWKARTIQKRFREVGFSPHRLRHTFATNLLERDVAIEVLQMLMGHASPATTLVYGKISKRRLYEGMLGKDQERRSA
jgi:integrase/recombinase XerD